MGRGRAPSPLDALPTGREQLERDGDVEGLVGPRLTLRRGDRPAAVVELPGARTVRVRADADVACVWAADGRVVAVDLATRGAVANVTVRVSA